MRETLQGFEGWAEYDTALYEHGTIENLLSYYVKLVESGVNAPDRRIGDLTVVSDEERSTLLVDWNRTAADYPRQQCVDHLVSDQCCLTPDKAAVECKGERLTYAQLNDRADRLATLLRAERVERGDLVGICVERSVGMLAAILGTLKSGAAYLPLDPAFPRGRLATMIEESRTRVILTQRDLLSVLPEGEPRKICLDELAPSVMTSSPLPLQAERNSRDLAYVLFTSGSTGRPKGVEISHQALVNLLWAMRRQPGLQAGDVLLAVTTLSFDIAGLELFLPLLVGAKVVIAPREITADGPRLAKLISESGATVMQATPTTWRMLIESGWHGDPRLKLLSGGEPLRADLAERLLQRCGELWNMYGPTETTVWSTTERVMAEQKITLGRPIANTQLYVLDEGRNPVPPGAAGELYIGGEGLARGYLNRPDLTNERFVPNPFDTSGVGRLYRTGDLVRYGPDGRTEFLGRTDQQVKVRGFRIELGEIEAALESTAGIGQAVVVVAPDAMGLNRLVAYVVPAGGSSDIRHNELVTTLRATLPESMVPSAFVVVEAIPLTPNGKVDRKALPPPQENAGIAEYEAPQGEVEEKLADIICGLLKVRQVGRTDSFFDLGGHSLLAVMLFAEIAQTFGMNLPLVTLFRAPSVQELARVLGEKRTHRPWASLVPIQPRGDRRKLFCVHGAGGNVLLYRDLARYFEQDRPFYGLQSQGLDRNAPCITTIEAMAEKYLQEVRALQPEGPYHLGGYCLGGTVAYEMAQQLRADGQQVALLALFDTYNFSRMTEPGSLSFILQKAHFHVSNLGHMGVNHWTGYLANKLRVARDGEWSALSKTALRAFGRSQRGRSRELSVSEVNDIAASAYRPQPYWGPVTLFKPRVNYDFLPDPRMGWGDLVRHLEIVELNVNPHAMLVEPYVRLLANELRRRMDAFDSPRRSQDHPALLAKRG
ncbi:MAG: non-ribosomal peptide synthetase [Acidobacteria bacterium]|nr:MAG: non-ribosomal peptide synthetase [Acidobacteriota bacterium]